jgi:hypothetical protein
MDFNEWQAHISRELLISKSKLKRHNYEEANDRLGVVGGLPSSGISIQSPQSTPLPRVDDQEMG